MKRLIYVSLLCAIAMSSCNNSSSQKLGSGIDMSNLDTSVNPIDDFYDYATGGWAKNNPMPAEYARYGIFDKLAEDNQKQVRELIEEIAKQQNEQGSVAQKIGTLYNMGMDSDKLNADGFEPIKEELQNIAAITDAKGLQEELANMHMAAIHPFFGLFGEADFSNSTMNIAWVYQGGLGMGERDYYLDNDEHTKEIRAKYKTLITNMLTYADAPAILKSQKTAEQLATDIIKLETRLAKASMSRVDERNPHNIFNKKTVEELQALAPAIDFKAYFAAMGVPQPQSLNVGQPEFMKEVSAIIKDANLNEIKAYLAWNVINEAAAFLSDQAAEENFAFYGKALSGREEMQPRWKRVVNTTNGSLGEAVGQMYVKKYFPAESKDRMVALVKNLQDALSERINGLEWMSNETKAKAQEKLGTFRVKIGYPDTWRDYSGLEIKEDSYYANIVRSRQFEMAYNLNKIDKPLDPTEWGMTPQTVNAYYNPTTNEICFPAGILQPPFFNAAADDAVNYGAIGVVIGHEMTHGFDDQGRQYDKDGNLKDWWTEDDATKFTNRTQVLVDFFNGIEVAPGVFADGKFTLGENIADNGGLQVSWVAVQKAIKDGKIADELDGFTAAQRFFIAYSTVWAGNIRDKEILRRTKEDPHSLGRWRVNATLKHINQFYDAFDVKEGDGMYIAPEERAAIW
ncbi:MAG: M13 family metallopeptidase [Prevotellaceae bacterium]|nr:M13 family metallopeptidase [Prevotellaceae bacterium]